MKLLFLAVVLLVWAVVVLFRLKTTGEAPDPITWGIPGGIWMLLYPPRRQNPDQPTAPAESEDTP